MTHKIILTEEDTKKIKVHIASEKDSKIYRRLLWLDLKCSGYQQKKISSILQMSRAQLTS